MEKSDRLKLKFFCSTDDEDLKVLDTFPNIVRNLFEEMWEHGHIGLMYNVKLGRYYYRKFLFEDNEADRKLHDHYTNLFLIGIPYAGRIIKWDLILKSSFGYLPDFVFDDDFQANPDVNLISHKLPSLKNWSPRNHSLIKVLKELLILYREFNLDKLKDRSLSIAKLKYEELVAANRFSAEDVEVLVRNNFVYILVPLEVNMVKLPPFVESEIVGQSKNSYINPHENKAALQFSFNSKNLEIETALFLSPGVEQVVGNSKSFAIPKYTNAGGMVDYVARLEIFLEKRIKTISESYEKRNAFISTILSQSGFAIIEYDEALFSMVSVLYDFEGIYAILLINVSEQFPEDQPIVTLLSVYQTTDFKPQKIICTDYPYSPRWEPQEMFERIVKHVGIEVSKLRP